jgi:hypothetical protein
VPVVATIRVGEEELYVEMSGFDRVWSLHSRLEIPLVHVAGARVDPDGVREASGTGVKAGGARVGHLTAGTFRQEGEWVFWDVHDADRSVIVELHDERYARLVVEVDDPAATAAEINQAAGRRP